MPLVFDLCGLIKYREVAIVGDAVWAPLGNNEIFRRAVNDSTPKSAVAVSVAVCVCCVCFGDLYASFLANFRF